ncbi:MAG: AmmeMemoRadiSam system protein B [Salinivirgaceae bacterium]|jgi:AmmeMemoRadiSam system protein B|nr:AmmeMemoRadiSam system protein B [Salinivirgaceae bacterium]
MSTRKAQFAGKFYPSEAKETQKLIEYIEKREINNLSHIADAELTVLGGVVPHAGLVYCGYQAVHFFHHIQKQHFDTVVIISPSHTANSPDVCIDSHLKWEIPGITYQTDRDLLNSQLFQHDMAVQKQEHAAEVMLPYLCYYRPEIKNISVITIGRPTALNTQEVAQKLVQFEKNSGKKILVIASSDFTHFESLTNARAKDDLVIDAIKKKNHSAVINTVKKHNISVCGYGSIAALIAFANLKSPEALFSVLRRGHSGEIIPSDEVVNYISILCSISKKKHQTNL